jgi:hypothetical protein
MDGEIKPPPMPLSSFSWVNLLIIRVSCLFFTAKQPSKGAREQGRRLVDFKLVQIPES